MKKLSEVALMRAIQIELGTRESVRLFRNNVGALKNDAGTWISYGLCPGSSDLIGLQSVTITPDMVGKRVAVFAAIEVKGSRGKTTDRQRAFIETIKSLGGRAGVARTLMQAWEIMHGRSDL
jgi:hypothetical protein